MTSIANATLPLFPRTDLGACAPPPPPPRSRRRWSESAVVSQLDADELAERATLGDIDAATELQLRYTVRLTKYALSIVCDEHEAERAVEAAFEEACAGWPPTRGHVEAWLLRIVRREARERARALWGSNA